METKRVYTKSTPKLVELHKKHGTGGYSDGANYFSNCNIDNQSGNFCADSDFGGLIEFYKKNSYTKLTEQEFIDFMELPIDKTNNPIEPSHYTQFDIQPIDYIESNRLDFFEGNVVKYVSRYKSKNGLEDLKKAQFYLNRLIERFASSESN